MTVLLRSNIAGLTLIAQIYDHRLPSQPVGLHAPRQSCTLSVRSYFSYSFFSWINCSYRRDAELSALVLDQMDMMTLMLWRQASRATCSEVTRCLRRTLHSMLDRYLPCTREFLRLLTHCHALIGGVFALAFIIRDTTLHSKILQVYTNDVWFQVLLEYLIYSPFVSPHILFDGITVTASTIQDSQDIRRCGQFTTNTGFRIHVYESRTISACSPISRSCASALMNFVNEDCFASAYPRLAFQRLSLISDMMLDNLTEDDRASIRTLLRAGFKFGVEPAQWPEYRPPASSPAFVGKSPCLRRLFICPDQGRYFGDPGSFLEFVDPISNGHQAALLRGVAPYCHMAVWRMWTSRACTQDCGHHDDVLHGGIISMPMLFVTSSVFYTTRASFPLQNVRPVLAYIPKTWYRRDRSFSV
ncbi:hypothetical protein C8Q76DRAFT_626209 [Earliella scabrosa]|nr:hypothetical protein C8Q76DRAFT_626209 [Earliella scabrosa]